MDSQTLGIIVAAAALVLGALYGAPRFALDLLKLRREWRREHPPKTVEQLLAEISPQERDPDRLMFSLRLLTIRAALGVFDLCLFTFVAMEAFHGFVFPAQVWLLIDAWLVAMVISGYGVIRRAKPLGIIVRIIELEKEERAFLAASK